MKTLYRIIAGILQGVFEWLPVSSSGMIVIVLTLLGEDPAEALSYAFFLHLGTALAAIYYFRKDVAEFLRTFPHVNDFRKQATVAVIVSAGIALGLIRFVHFGLEAYGYALVGLMLIITGITLELKRFGSGSITRKASIAAGIAQGLAIVPGLSRSGLTLAALGLAGVEGSEALRFSFIISVPAVIGASLLLGFPGISLGPLIGLVCSFLFGFLTIDALMKLSQKIRRGPFLILLGALSLTFYGLSKRVIFTLSIKI